jgi:glutathione synthase/RimK-type ligase-like ATP-grasp enzyme
MLKVLPYKRGSRSAKALAQAVGALRIVSTNYRQKYRDTILNWGASNPTQRLIPEYNRVLNRPVAVSLAANKLGAFRQMERRGVKIPEYTTQQEIAQGWANDGETVFARTVLNGHSGQGIVVTEGGETVPYAPLYTKYVKKDAEFRVHVFKGNVIDYARKKRRNGFEEATTHNERIRNHANGWVFAREGVIVPEVVKAQALKAVEALGLDFGAVDIAWRDGGSSRPEQTWVYEVNTAPGLEGTTLQRYAQAVREYAIGY